MEEWTAAAMSVRRDTELMDWKRDGRKGASSESVAAAAVSSAVAEAVDEDEVEVNRVGDEGVGAGVATAAVGRAGAAGVAGLLLPLLLLVYPDMRRTEAAADEEEEEETDGEDAPVAETAPSWTPTAARSTPSSGLLDERRGNMSEASLKAATLTRFATVARWAWLPVDCWPELGPAPE